MTTIYDIAVIGGGATGTGIARDAALRGLKTILIEKKDFSAGTTGACGGMIHGGSRYLLFDVETTRLSCMDSGYIQNIASNLIFRIPFLIPVMKDDKYGIEKWEAFLKVYDKFQKYKSGKGHTRLTKEEALKLEPGLSHDIVGALSMDEWGIDVFRLTVLNALSAREAGAEIRNHTEVAGFIKKGQRVIGIRVKDKISGKAEDIEARIIVNAAGPWVTKIAKMAGASVKLRPSRGVQIVFERRISNLGMTITAIDGRPLYFIPHEHTTILGTTDDDYFGDPDNLPIYNDDIEYLLTSAQRVFPEIRKYRRMRAMAGLRPSLFEWGKVEEDVSREFEIFDHEKEGASGFITIAGGKLAMYRLMAEKVIDLICQKLKIEKKCTTHTAPLPGAEETVDTVSLTREFKMPLYPARRLIFKYGTRARDILKMIKADPYLGSVICNCEAITEAEIRYCIRNEWAYTIDDLRRRTRLGMGPCQGMRCASTAAAVLGYELGWNSVKIKEETVNFLQERWKGKRPLLDGDQIAQEELNQAVHHES